VDFEEAAVVLFGALVDAEGVEPGGGEFGDGDATVSGVDPGAVRCSWSMVLMWSSAAVASGKPEMAPLVPSVRR
jgi:hypothetical protein